jgi:hypothetical protein
MNVVRIALALLCLAGTAAAATLPAHAPRRILIIADAVNPHGLSDAMLTQPADIKAALEAADSGIALTGGTATLVDSQCIDQALTSLTGATPPDVVIYFAHTGAESCAGANRQPELTAAFTTFLEGGGGIVVFHHGLYYEAVKQPILTLLGGQSTGYVYEAGGQRVFNISPSHFVTSNGVTYAGTDMLTAGAPVPGGTFSYFDNVPDERYDNLTLHVVAGEQRDLLFATDSNGTRPLGYALQRAGWQGRVVAYQPGEIQPLALDDRDGPNFQILANAIHFVARPPAPPGGNDAGTIPSNPDAASLSDGSLSPPDADPLDPPSDGCDCRVGARSGHAAFGWAILVSAWLFLGRRRRR